MPRKFAVYSMAFLLMLSFAILAQSDEGRRAERIIRVQSTQAPTFRDACQMTKFNGVPEYVPYLWSGTQAIQYFDPADLCTGTPTYPFEISSLTFTLYSVPDEEAYPVPLDIVVYDIAPSGSICDGPGAELCRISAVADSLTFQYPELGTVTFPTPCCVNGPFFLGIEMTGTGTGIYPSIVTDGNAAPDTCELWMYNGLNGPIWEEWRTYFVDPVGFPYWYVNGETGSGNCPQSCTWNPGDDHKMHFPQLPDEAGWDVNATSPNVLADDFMCTETGMIKDIHFWGGWKNDYEGQIQYFVLSLHEDIPADPPSIPYSRPGFKLWQWETADFDVVPFDPPSTEGWYDPSSGLTIWNSQSHYYQYNVCLPEEAWFPQDSGTIYWLTISASVTHSSQWGWKSTQDHWNDDAVWAHAGVDNWIDIWEPAQPLSANFVVQFNQQGQFMGGGSADAFGQGWYYYPQSGWWNIWFYDHPFAPERKKTGFLEFNIVPLDPYQPNWAEVAVNWSTDAWSIDQPPGDSSPPLPGVNEDLYIGREILWEGNPSGSVGPLPYEIPDYNPEWISVDVRGLNFLLSGTIEHTCQGSLDLAFVITGEPVVEDSGACCYDPTGGPPSQCIYTTQTHCEQILGGVFEGVGIPCTAPEACCLLGGGCIMADPLCCVNELGGVPQGAGSQCTAIEACCLPDGTCQDLDPLCCLGIGGTPQGAGSQCTTALEACCMPDGSCQMLDPLCCVDQGGTPQGPGSDCSGTIACCLPDGTCQTVSPVCCDDLGGTPSPFGAPMCLGDLNGDGTDDACMIRDDLKWRQAPDLDLTGIDVDASCVSITGVCLVLADDYLCTQTGPVTEIHLYTSWIFDVYPLGEAGLVDFTLSLHADVPAGVDQPWSHPGELLWMKTFQPGEFQYRPYAMGVEEDWLEPWSGIYLINTDSVCWEYIFTIPEDSQFIQQGTETNPVVYWLDVQASPITPGQAVLGWKTSLDHWNDDAVWAVGEEPIDPLVWAELIYPPSHPFAYESIDLAFEIYGEAQAPCDCIPGDAQNDGTVNVADAVYIINYVFKGGPAPVPYTLCSGDANCDCQLNVGDAVYVINYVFKGGPPPCDCPTWLSLCGPPLRK